MPRIHWCGAGLSAVPGLRRLIAAGHSMTVWNRTLDRAKAATAGLSGDFNHRVFDLGDLTAALKPGDIAVSMLPGDWHPAIAKACLAAGAHFASSSYVSPEIRALGGAAEDAGLVFVNEVGLDPGLDHMMAHDLVARYRESPAFDAANELSFYSYCGGLSEVPNEFRYKFSWSPLGVLKALRSPSRSLRGGETLDVARPWDAISAYELDLPGGAETFEVYPNRDSLPFIEEYGFDPAWRVKDFVRGTLRYGGWSDAWSDIFKEVEGLSGPEGEARLKEMSEEFWRLHAVKDGEADRVVLSVELHAARGGKTVWAEGWRLDAIGGPEGSAMARLVSIPLSLAIEAALDGEIAPGVSAAPANPALVARFLAAAKEIAAHMERVALS
ncbi:MAG: saccharopine dehydrogenase family protein [Paracoccaceae bacterium]